ncbi:rhodopsin [Haloarcula salina]|uniref:rhodopsin n=1 Tax=Haloarcula salina TaxID=1429914 RepID=UPI003C70089A
MFSPSAVYGTSAVVYALALVVLVTRLRGMANERRRYCYPVVAVLVVSMLCSVLVTAGIGQIPVNGAEVDVPGLIDDLITYPVLWGVAVMLAGVSRRTLAALAAIPVTQVLAFQVASVIGGLVGLVGLLVVVGGHGVIAYLLLGPIWADARDVPAKQRLLHWKSRNLLLFLVGMLIAFAVLSLFGLFDSFVVVALGQYVDVLIRVGVASFLFANVESIAVGTLDGMPDDRSGALTETTGAD